MGMRIDQRMTPVEARAWWRREAAKEVGRKHHEIEFHYTSSVSNTRGVVSDPMRRKQPTNVSKEWYCQGHYQRRLNA